MRALAALAWLFLLLHPALGVAAEPPPPRVRAGLFVTSLSNINFASGSFTIVADAWFVDPTGRFDPQTQVELSGREGQLETLSKERLPDGSVYVWTRIRVVVDQSFDVADFPKDRQSLVFTLDAEDPADAIRFAPDVADTGIGDRVAISGWKVVGVELEEQVVRFTSRFGYPAAAAEPSAYSRLVLTVDIARQRSVLVVDKFLGLTMGFLISLLMYLVRPSQLGVKVSLATTAILAAVGNRYSLDALLGPAASFGLVDQVTLIAFASIYTATASSILVYYVEEGQGVRVATRLDRRIGLVTSLLYLTLGVAAFLYAGR